MALSIMSSRIVWATPVRPDTLGQHLEAYKKFLPTRNALRLCYKFGKGPKVNINKIPEEILQMIEDIIFHYRCSKTARRWLPYFRHFENRCEPLDHLDFPEEMYPEVKDECHEERCEECKEAGDCYAYDKGCNKIVEEKINQGLVRHGGFLEVCDEKCERWKNLISQEDGGNFIKYHKLLRKHFGLEAYFATTRIYLNRQQAWPEEENDIWYDPSTFKTTICYLTLPKHMVKKSVYTTNLSEVDDAEPEIDGLQSSLVQIPSLEHREKQMKQFANALKTLRLEPYVHSSQLTQFVAADPLRNHLGSGQSEAKEEDSKDAMGEYLAKVEWPQLVMLVNAGFNLP